MTTTVIPPKQVPINFPSVESKKDLSVSMKAAEWHGNKDIRLGVRSKPMVTDPTDAVIRVTSSTICGSDLHLYHNEFSGMEKGDVLGHEFMGIVDSVGPNVTTIKPGDRVVVSCIIACGQCQYCKNQLFSNCDTTNPSKEMEKLYGHRTAGIFGYSHMTGGYDGGQAEFTRVPYADMNCLKLEGNKPDEQYLFLSDIACTGWHACELGGVTQGSTVVVWGCGPVGLMAQMWAKFRGASRVIGIDGIDYRLKMALNKVGSEVIDFRNNDVVEAIKKLLPGGPDICIDAAGFRFPKSLLHKFQRAVSLETDSPQILTEAITSVRKGGVISVVGDYYAYANQFPIGAFMEKGLTMRAGQVYVHKYWKQIKEWIDAGKVDLTFLITHTMPLDDVTEAYRIFDEKDKESMKIILKPTPLLSKVTGAVTTGVPLVSETSTTTVTHPVGSSTPSLVSTTPPVITGTTSSTLLPGTMPGSQQTMMGSTMPSGTSTTMPSGLPSGTSSTQYQQMGSGTQIHHMSQMPPSSSLGSQVPPSSHVGNIPSHHMPGSHHMGTSQMPMGTSQMPMTSSQVPGSSTQMPPSGVKSTQTAPPASVSKTSYDPPFRRSESGNNNK